MYKEDSISISPGEFNESHERMNESEEKYEIPY